MNQTGQYIKRYRYDKKGANKKGFKVLSDVCWISFGVDFRLDKTAIAAPIVVASMFEIVRVFWFTCGAYVQPRQRQLDACEGSH